jgi:hypothetical protein
MSSANILAINWQLLLEEQLAYWGAWNRVSGEELNFRN